MSTDSRIHTECHIELEHRRLSDGEGIDGDHCICLPDDPVTWKKEVTRMLEGNEMIFLTLTNNLSGEFGLVFGYYPNDEAIQSIDGGFPECRHFGATFDRATLQQIHDAIAFLLTQTPPVPSNAD